MGFLELHWPLWSGSGHCWKQYVPVPVDVSGLFQISACPSHVPRPCFAFLSILSLPSSLLAPMYHIWYLAEHRNHCLVGFNHLYRPSWNVTTMSLYVIKMHQNLANTMRLVENRNIRDLGGGDETWFRVHRYPTTKTGKKVPIPKNPDLTSPEDTEPKPRLVLHWLAEFWDASGPQGG